MSVFDRTKQHKVLIEAVQNHTPQIIVVDEIGTHKEVQAVQTICQRGVGIVGTAHGLSIHSLLSNPELNSLVGGVRSVILGDKAASERSREQRKNHWKNQENSGPRKNICERGHEAPFFVLVEVLDRNHFRIFRNVDQSVDDLLLKGKCVVEERWIDGDGHFRSRFVEARKPKKSS
eukprot:TRINITY_DN8238_c0_g4_i2.p1 TRINITY_DN8238_c0_g4~~TRINITY_DN8238_c0_g4_i2.p1  ORF type:complete len:176 (-),score=39.89 TRINITY_DN8238_c0_g4_i2:146-673(-)